MALAAHDRAEMSTRRMPARFVRTRLPSYFGGSGRRSRDAGRGRRSNPPGGADGPPPAELMPTPGDVAREPCLADGSNAGRRETVPDARPRWDGGYRTSPLSLAP